MPYGSLAAVSPLPHPVRRRATNLTSRRLLQQTLGAIWLLDGLLQLQPSMFSSYLVDGVMRPATAGQPGIVAAGIQPAIALTSQHLLLTNAAIALVQIALGLCLLAEWRVRWAILFSAAWSLLVWYGGEGLGMVLTGQASILTGAPGPVLLYALLGLAAYPTGSSEGDCLLSRQHLRWALAGIWGLAAVLQLQPFWWQPNQIAQTIGGNESSTLNGLVLNPVLRCLAHGATGHEVLLNAAFVVVSLSLAIALVVVRGDFVRPLLAMSIVLSLSLWLAMEGCGQLLTGTATDVNSGPLLVLLALACWPRMETISRPHRSNRAQRRMAGVTGLTSLVLARADRLAGRLLA